MNLRPDLFRACVLNVPFLDVLTTLLDESLPLTIPDHLEFGNPIESENDYWNIKGFSPYENLQHKEYPAALINLSQEDTRVPLWGSLKFVEKLRDLAKTPTKHPNFGNKNIVVRINKEGGHFGNIENEENLKMLAFEFAWLDYIMFKKNNE